MAKIGTKSNAAKTARRPTTSKVAGKTTKAAGKLPKPAEKNRAMAASTKKVAAKKAPAKNTAGKKLVKKTARKAAQKTLPPRFAVAPAIIDQMTLTAALDALSLADPIAIAHMREVAGMPPLRNRAPGFEGLAAIIVSQQVSTAAAATIFARVEAAINPLTPAAVLACDEAALRACGLSMPKQKALRAIAHAIHSGDLGLEMLAEMEAHEAHDALCAVNGIGPWSANIFLLFCLGHSDAWPAGDLALQEAARIALKLRARPDAKQLEKIGERWRPHRAVAARLLWAYYAVVKQGRSGMSLT